MKFLKTIAGIVGICILVAAAGPACSSGVDVEALQAEIDALTAERDALDEDLDEAEAANETLEAANTTLETANTTLQADLDDATADYDALTAELEDSLWLEDFGIMYVSGEKDDNHDSYVKQAPVHYFIPKEVKYDYPIIMIPGLGLSSYIYLSTPDGRDGWATVFAKAGFEVYVMDEPNNAVSSFDSSATVSMKWTVASSFATWGFGATYPTPYEDTQFPIDVQDQFWKSITPVMTGGTGQFGYVEKADALAALLEEIGESIVMCHSASGKTAMEAMNLEQELFRALIAVEPTSMPSVTQDILDYFTDVPYLAVYGDNIAPRGQTGRYDACANVVSVLDANGKVGEMLEMPAEGVDGNTHIMMVDLNSHDIAGRIIDWLDEDAL